MELTNILDTLKTITGVLAEGALEIDNPAFIAGDGTAVVAGPLTYTVNAGVVNLNLAPTQDSVKNELGGGEARYTVRYKLSNLDRHPEIWAVPRTGGPYTISQVRGD